MSWYKSPEWQQGLAVLFEWWEGCNDFIQSDFEDEPRDLNGLAFKLADFCYDVAGIDPMPLWELTLMIDSHRRRGKFMPDEYPVSQPRILYQRDKVLMIYYRLRRVGIVNQKPREGGIEIFEKGIYTDTQVRILKALDGVAMKKEPLEHVVGSGLYKKGGIKELRAMGKVDHQNGAGYFRPDAPPPDRAKPNGHQNGTN